MDDNYPHQELTGKILGAAIAVHRALGPGFIESVYENAMIIELTRRGLHVRQQVPFQILYEGQPVGEHRADLIVEDAVVLELKAVAELLPIHEAQTLSTVKAAGLQIALLINFNVRRLMDGVVRIGNIY